VQTGRFVLSCTNTYTEQTKRLTLKVLFTGDGSPTKNVRRIWLAFLSSLRTYIFLRRLAHDSAKPSISILVNLAGPFFGTQLMVFYGQALLQGVGIQGDEITLALAAINTGVPIGMAISFVILPRAGRRPMLCWGGTVRRTSNQPAREYQILTKMLLSSLLPSCASSLVSQTSKIPRRAFNGGFVVGALLFNIVNGASWIWLGACDSFSLSSYNADGANV